MLIIFKLSVALLDASGLFYAVCGGVLFLPQPPKKTSCLRRLW